jgi:hypothetical protein
MAGLREAGVAVPVGLAVQVHEATAPRMDAATAHLVLPLKPAETELVVERVARFGTAGMTPPRVDATAGLCGGGCVKCWAV